METYRGDKIQKLIEKNKKSKGDPKVLDIGCGENNKFFNFKNYIGLDINDYGMKYDIRKIDLNEKTELPFKNDEFDLVLCTEFLEHTFRPDVLSREINRVTKKDGLIIISLPNEFTLNCRIGYMLNKVRNEGFNLYSHKYIFNIEKIDEFMHDYYDVLEKDHACMGIGLEKLPGSLRDFLILISPSLFAKSVIYACKPRK